MTPAAFVAACALDALAGDPRGIPHPVRAIGSAAGVLEKIVRGLAGGNATAERIGGAAMTAALVGGSALFARKAQRAASPLSFAGLVDIAMAWQCLAARDLIVEVNAVLEAMNRNDLDAARTRLARIVGRDTNVLDRAGISRALIETLAESCCDGIVAPLCALAFGGPPLAFAFKAASTLDSMIGHIEPPYTHVGYAAAKLDDLFCFFPARITAVAIAACAPSSEGSARSAFAIARRDGSKHASPNAGLVEAAMAGALGVRLGGPLRYDGVLAEREVLGGEYALPNEDDVRRARAIVVAASLLVFGVLATGMSVRAVRVR